MKKEKYKKVKYILVKGRRLHTLSMILVYVGNGGDLFIGGRYYHNEFLLNWSIRTFEKKLRIVEIHYVTRLVS